MDKQKIKSILMSMRTHENETNVNNILGKIDIMSQEEINTYLEKIGHSEKDLKNFFESKLNKPEQSNEHIPINDMFTYGIAGNCIHLHLPGDLHQMIEEIGWKGTMNTVNLNLLDAINRIKTLKNNEFYKFNNIDCIYMISPILMPQELKFLEDMDFETHFLRKKALQNNKFLEEDKEALLAVSIFGDKQNIGSAKIDFSTLTTPMWQEKCHNKMLELKEKGAFVKQEEKKEK